MVGGKLSRRWTYLRFAMHSLRVWKGDGEGLKGLCGTVVIEMDKKVGVNKDLGETRKRVCDTLILSPGLGPDHSGQGSDGHGIEWIVITRHNFLILSGRYNGTLNLL